MLLDQAGGARLTAVEHDENPNADFLERTGSEILGARLWWLPPKSANTLHRHPKAEEFYFVIEGTGRMRVSDETVPFGQFYGGLAGWEEHRSENIG